MSTFFSIFGEVLDERTMGISLLNLDMQSRGRETGRDSAIEQSSVDLEEVLDERTCTTWYVILVFRK